MKTTSKGLLLLVSVVGVVTLAGCPKNPSTVEPKTGEGKDTATSVDKPEFPANGAQSANGTNADGIDTEKLNEEQRLVDSLMRPIFFAFDKYDLTQESRDTLTANAHVLHEHTAVDIWIEGHCDERGTNEYNLALGDRRARAARDFLVAAGIGADRMTVISYGEEKPAKLGHDEAAWSQNRRDAFKAKGQGIGL